MNNPNHAVNRRILVIDDNPSIHADFRKILCGLGESNAALENARAFLFGDVAQMADRTVFEIDSAFQGEEGLRMVRESMAAGRPYALAFVDVRMPPGWDGVETIEHIWKDCPELQVVICSAHSDYSWEEMVRQLGRTDNLLILKKPFDNIEVLQLAHALTEKWGLNRELKGRLSDLDGLVNQRTAELQCANDELKKEIAGRTQTEKSLRLSEERFSKAFKASPIPLAIRSLLDEKYVDVNEGFLEITGFLRAELIGRTPKDLGLWENPDLGRQMLGILREEMSVRNLSCRLRTKSGQMKDVLLSVELFELDGEPHLLIIAQDMTEQMQLEHQFRQAQKMEAIGQLAAGVAHDFNNILTVVQGNATILLGNHPPSSIEHKPLSTICAAAERAGKLVRQLLTFSRKQVRQPRNMDVRGTITSVCEMLPRLLGEEIKVNVIAPAGLPFVNADAGMMEQMLMNLAVNARDAMSGGGTLTIAAEEVTINIDEARRNREARAGRFVSLSVRDTGCGMPPEVLDRIFEPFYTTKPVGKGTGLGLATVYGIAKQHEGWIEVQSEPGNGSTFRVFMPACINKGAAPSSPAAPQVFRGGTESVLVVEDEEEVRAFVVKLLASHGYRVFEAASGLEALQTLSSHEKRIQLLLTDMVMPGGILGRELAEQLTALDPELKVIYTSGYSPGMAGKDLALLEGHNFLAKPYPPSALLSMVREVLDRPPACTALPVADWVL
jgi:PAS domain S-box-containing protein